MKRFDIGTEELNNKFTIFLGDLRTDIESAKWDATRRAICKLLQEASLTHSHHCPPCYHRHRAVNLLPPCRQAATTTTKAGSSYGDSGYWRRTRR
jgi:hypothetical protein